jgi:hypothetical protein
MITIIALLKFGNQKNILDLYNNGTIYINTIEHFRKIEDEELRGDKYEGVSRIINSLPGTFKLDGNDTVFNFNKIHIRESYSEIVGNIYSLYALSSKGFQNPLELKFDKKNTRFGTHCLMIKNLPYFLEKIELELNKNNYNFQHGFIDYYDKYDVNRNINLFEKPLEFEYQKEFRFYIENYDMKPIKIQIGSLKKYAEIINIEDLIYLKLK